MSFINKVDNGRQDKYSPFINTTLVNNLKKFSRIIAYLLAFTCLVILLITEQNFSGIFVSELKQFSVNAIFNLLILLSFLILSSKDKRYFKYSKIIFYCIIVLTVFFIFAYANIFNLANYIIFFKGIFSLGLIRKLIFVFALYSLIYERHYKISQSLLLVVVICGFFSFFYFLHAGTLNPLYSLYYFLFYLLFSVMFIVYSSDKGIFKQLNLNTDSSTLARRIFLSSSFFLTILCFMLIIMYYYTPINEITSELILGIGCLVFLVGVMFYYNNKINFSDYEKLKVEKESHQKEVFFEDILHFTVEGVLYLNKDLKIVYANQEFNEAFNTDDHDIVGEDYLEVYPKTPINDKIIKCSEDSETKFFEETFRTNKREIIITGWIIPFIQNDKFNGVIITGLDITNTEKRQSALKNSMDEKNALLTEVHHRVKNNMQIIISLLNLQSHKIQDQAAKDAIFQTQTRIRSMALVHENLYKNFDFADMNIEVYINDLVNEIRATYMSSSNISFKTDVIKAFISIDIAISLGLIINELLTNCIKYAFPDLQKGTVWVKLYEQNDEYVLIVQDDGVGANNSKIKGTGIGSTLIESLVMQINGYYQIEGNNGTKVTIKFEK